MAETAPRMPLSQDEAAALGLAVLAHVGLVAALVYLKPADVPPPLPERMEVTISEETGLVSTSPDSQADPAADSGPVVGDMVPPPVPEPVEVAKADVRPRPPVAPPRPAPVPVARAQVQPKVQPPVRTVQPQAKPVQRSQTQPRGQTQPRPGTRPGNSRFADAFGDGIPGGNPASKSKNPPAQATGQQKSSWSSQIGSRITLYWEACPVSGLEVEKLYANVHFTLAIDGSIAAIDDFEVLGQTPANRAQAAPFKACVYKAIRRAAPFKGLPTEFYNDWKPRNQRFSKRNRS